MKSFCNRPAPERRLRRHQRLTFLSLAMAAAAAVAVVAVVAACLRDAIEEVRGGGRKRILMELTNGKTAKTKV